MRLFGEKNRGITMSFVILSTTPDGLEVSVDKKARSFDDVLTPSGMAAALVDAGLVQAPTAAIRIHQNRAVALGVPSGDGTVRLYRGRKAMYYKGRELGVPAKDLAEIGIVRPSRHTTNPAS